CEALLMHLTFEANATAKLKEVVENGDANDDLVQYAWFLLRRHYKIESQTNESQLHNSGYGKLLGALQEKGTSRIRQYEESELSEGYFEAARILVRSKDALERKKGISAYILAPRK